MACVCDGSSELKESILRYKAESNIHTTMPLRRPAKLRTALRSLVQKPR